MSAAGSTVVIGLGNVILSDDGVGVHAVRRLRERPAIAEDVVLIEGGTAGLLLLPSLADARRAILVDAIDTGAAPGTLTRLDGKEWMSGFSIRMTPHDVALEDLLSAAQLTDAWPEKLVLLGVQPASIALGIELTPPVADAVHTLIDAVVSQLDAWGAVCA
jgi:hydrogenase maturation protease